MWGIGGTEASFRDTFLSWLSKQWFPSASYHRMRSETTCIRKHAILVFSKFFDESNVFQSTSSEQLIIVQDI